MLALAMEKAKKIRLTFDPDNIDSRKTIKENDGSLTALGVETGELLYAIRQ